MERKILCYNISFNSEDYRVELPDEGQYYQYVEAEGEIFEMKLCFAKPESLDKFEAAFQEVINKLQTNIKVYSLNLALHLDKEEKEYQIKERWHALQEERNELIKKKESLMLEFAKNEGFDIDTYHESIYFIRKQFDKLPDKNLIDKANDLHQILRDAGFTKSEIMNQRDLFDDLPF